MFHARLSNLLRPDFTWTSRRSYPLLYELPEVPKPKNFLVQLFWGYVHRLLIFFSLYYCAWTGYQYNGTILALPFGLLIKHTDGLRVEEAIVGDMIHKAGLPAPKILSFGLQPHTPHAPGSILMTRVPGRTLNVAYDSLSFDARQTFVEEFKLYMSVIRSWKNPWGNERVCSITGGALHSFRSPAATIPSFTTAQDFYDYLLGPARNTFSSENKFQELIQEARKLQHLQGPVMKFTHGDLKHHNILVDDDGHITGLIDWDTAGWLPDYWDFTTAMRFMQRGNWWLEMLIEAGGSEFLDFRESERALFNLTADSY